ncbi:hypothetical protein ACS0TY_003414 [Phlomoides rotata]
MREIEGLNGEEHEYLRAIDVSKWTFSHDGGHRYEVMTTNISEAINGVLMGARRLPITAIKDQQLGMKHTVDLYNHSRRTTKVTIHMAGMMRYRTYRVSLLEQECDCGQWMMDGFFAPLPDMEEWDEPNFQLRHNPERRIRRRG